MSSPMPTMSLRAPTEHHAILREVAKALRGNPQLIAEITCLLQGPLPIERTAVAERAFDETAEKRLEALEGTVQALATRIAEIEQRAQEAPAPSPPRIAKSVAPRIAIPEPDPTIEPPLFPDGPPSGEVPQSHPSPVWTRGEGRGRRLTAEGEAEAMRLIATGQSDNEIAATLGVAPNTITNRRKSARG